MVTRISVIMSVFNEEDYLRESIESILNQKFRDFEFIIINDGSNHKAQEILEEYKKKDSRIQIINNKENIGLTKSLNKAIKIAQGKYIARQDADDISLPERLGKQIEFLKNHPKVKILGTFGFAINSNGKILRKETRPVSFEEIKKLLIKRNPFIHSSMMIEKEILDRVGVYNEDFKTSQDYELWFRILKVAKGENLPLFLMKKRFSHGMISLTRENTQLKYNLFLRKTAIKKGDYPKFCFIYSLRPYLTLKCPAFLKKIIRKYFSKSKNIFKEIYQ